MRTTSLTAGLMLVVMITAWGQSEWEGGILLGGANYQGDLVETLAPIPAETNLAYGGFIRANLNSVWALRLRFAHASITGTDANFSDPRIAENRNFSFRNDVTSGALLLEWDPWGKLRYPEPRQFRKRFTPFLYTGLGGIYHDPVTNFGDNGVGMLPEEMMDQNEEVGHLRFSLPVGGGVKWDLSRRLILGAELSTLYAFSDMLDGISHSGNPDTNDWYWVGGLNLSLRFVPRDTDEDGVPDDEDKCPMLAGSISAAGCPDRDADGVEDAEDVCPDVAGALRHNGCPDSDGDGIMNLLDQCPQAFGYEATNGCPDRDYDCVADAEDDCPDTEGLPEFRGCPDSDGDLVADPLDPCPNMHGAYENGGCPLPDTDCDGVLDRDDYCPRLAGEDSMTGCPDSDRDGVIDREDRCPELAGEAANKGCPELAEAEKAVIENARRQIRFETGSAILTADSKVVLDSIAKVLRKYSHYGLRMEGYTDSVGDDDANLRLSQRRAKACYDYLLYKGIGPKRLQYAGYGEANPIGDNRTSRGRLQNRRVTFELFLLPGQRLGQE